MPRQSLHLDLDSLALSGYTNFSGMPRAATTDTALLVASPQTGMVAVIHKILLCPMGLVSTSPAASPGGASSVYSTLRLNTGGTNVDLFFHAFDKLPTLGAADLQAHPNLPTVWEPRKPIIVPSGWNAYSSTHSDAGGVLGVIGSYMSEYEARQLGYDCAPEASQASRNWIAASSIFTSTATQNLAAARTGYSIEITDIFVRLMPLTTTATITLQDTAGAVIAVYKHDNRTTPGQVVVKPRIFLADGVGLDAVASANAVYQGSLVVLGRYVRNADKPGDAWYSCVQPTFPSPGAPGDGLGNKANTTLKAAPGINRELVVEGYWVNVSKDSTSPADQDLTKVVIAAITTGTPATFGAAAAAIPNKCLTPYLVIGSQGQEIDLVLDEVNMRCLANAPVTWEARSLTSPTDANAHIDGWSVLIWGRTRPSTQAVGSSDNLQGAAT